AGIPQFSDPTAQALRRLTPTDGELNSSSACVNEWRNSPTNDRSVCITLTDVGRDEPLRSDRAMRWVVPHCDVLAGNAVSGGILFQLTVTSQDCSALEYISLDCGYQTE